MRRLRIVFDALVYNRQAAGIGQYVRELLGAMVDRFGSEDTVEVVAAAGVDLPATRLVHVKGPVNRSAVRLLYEQLVLAGRVSKHDYGVIHFPDYQMPVIRRLPRTVITVHDLVAFKFPDLFPSASGGVKRLLMRPSARHADAVIVPSQATRHDAIEILGADPDRVFVVPHGVRRRGKAASVSPHPRPYFLAVGTVEPRKNFARLIAAYALLARKERGEVPDLLIAGRLGWLYQDALKAPAKWGVADRVTFLHYVSDDVLASLYRHSLALVYPSLYEGFGLPVIEAMGAGIPVISSARGALAEVGKNVAIWVDPLDIESIAQGLATVLTGDGKIRQQVQAGIERANEYTWDNAAQKTRAVYAEVRA